MCVCVSMCTHAHIQMYGMSKCRNVLNTSAAVRHICTKRITYACGFYACTCMMGASVRAHT